MESQVTEQQLRSIFVPFGDIVYVKIPSGKGCGFVQLSQRSDAETAMLQMNGQVCAPQGHPVPVAELRLHPKESYSAVTSTSWWIFLRE